MRTVLVLAWGVFAALLVGCGAWAVVWFATSAPPRSAIQPALASNAVIVATIHFNSDPQGADAKTSIGWSCRTPCSIELSLDGPFTVTFTRPGFAPRTVPVELEPGQPGEAHAKFAPNPVFAALPPLRAPKANITARARTAASRPTPPTDVHESQTWWCRLFGCS